MFSTKIYGMSLLANSRSSIQPVMTQVCFSIPSTELQALVDKI
jgi:hypothetical protein